MEYNHLLYLTGCCVLPVVRQQLRLLLPVKLIQHRANSLATRMRTPSRDGLFGAGIAGHQLNMNQSNLLMAACFMVELSFADCNWSRTHISSASKAVKQGPAVGKAAIGGSFNLINHDGKSVTDKDFLGKWTLIYFGFTHCPDICPDELQKLAAAVDKIKEKSRIEVVPVFISVDPERDTVEQVHEYVKEFHPKLIGLTGTPDEVKKAARAYRVYYMKTEEEGSDYLVDHSIVMYLMDPRMEFVKFFGKNNDVDSLVDGVITEIKQYKKVKA
ncbi:hypothetical protein RJ639_018011 [Escallonia herrerae]|uniref:Thioredoxin domain-containing protein n=1 Tax=Escallonia herrerae TaxID=1293975 RepID=A0AA88V8N7_9ASTE|nr:hypothetical protein RJ639_018011 [Escallonia herrerae]